MKTISDELYEKLDYLGLIPNETRSYNVGNSNYKDYVIQPWSIILDHNLDYFDGDIVKRTLRSKNGEPRKNDYLKIKHICDEKIRQIEAKEKNSCTTEHKTPRYGCEYLCIKPMVFDMGSEMTEFFTENFYYTSHHDGCITDNYGCMVKIDENRMNEYFKLKK